jgi:ABC-type lipoprotein release transport system permease subunit
MKKGYLLRLGTKNLSRYKKRTFITMLVLAVGIACYIMIDSLLLGTMKESENNLIRYEMGQGRLVTPTYWEEWKDRPLDSGIPAPDKIINQLKTEGISAVKRIEFISQAIVHTGIGGSFPVVVTAVDMERDLEVLDTLDKLSEGRLPHSEEDGVVIGQWMAQDLAIGLGDQITIPIIDRWGSRDAMALEVTGLLNTPNPEINKGGFFIPLEGADYYLDMEGMVSYIAVDFPQIGSEKRKALALLKELAQREGLEYHKWEDWSADYLAVASGDVYSSGFILFLIFIIAFVGTGQYHAYVGYGKTERDRHDALPGCPGQGDSFSHSVRISDNRGNGLTPGHGSGSSGKYSPGSFWYRFLLPYEGNVRGLPNNRYHIRSLVCKKLCIWFFGGQHDLCNGSMADRTKDHEEIYHR